MAIAFHEVRFPEDISYASSGGPAYSTDIVTMKNGSEQRNVNYTQPRCKYNAALGVKTAEQMAKVIEFFHARKGRGFGFRYKDWSDYRLDRELIAVGDGAKNRFQIIKTYTSGGFSTVRKIRKPVSDTAQIYLDSTPAQGWTVDYTSGVVRFKKPPPAGRGIYCTCEFDVPVRFDTDHMDVNLQEGDHFMWTSIPLIELREGVG